MNENKPKTIRNTIIMFALTAILTGLTFYVPAVSTVGMFICGLPVACIAAQNNNKITVISVLLIFMLTFFLVSDVAGAAAFVLMAVAPYAVAGRCGAKKSNFFSTLLLSCITVCLGWIATIYFINMVTDGQGFAGIIDSSMAQLVQSFEANMKNMPSEANPDEIEKILNGMIETMKATMKLFFPSIVILSSLFMGYIMVRLSGWLITKLKFGNVYTVPFSMLKAPRSMSFVAIVIYLCSMLGNGEGTFHRVSANVILILYTIIGICGLSLVDSKLKKKIKNGVLRWIFYVAVTVVGGALIDLITTALVLVGILDSSHNFRRIPIMGDLYGSGDEGEGI